MTPRQRLLAVPAASRFIGASLLQLDYTAETVGKQGRLWNYSLSPCSCPVDHAARDFRSRVTGGLGVDIIRIAMNYHASPKNIPNPETIRPNRHMCAPLLHHQGRQIARMSRMNEASGIIVAACLRKVRADAAVSLMDVKAEKAGFTVLRQVGYVSLHQYAAGVLIKPNLAVDIRCVRSASDVSHRIRASEVSIHEITSLQHMSEGKALYQKTGVFMIRVLHLSAYKKEHFLFRKCSFGRGRRIRSICYAKTGVKGGKIE